jgi:hypothetical protein
VSEVIRRAAPRAADRPISSDAASLLLRALPAAGVLVFYWALIERSAFTYAGRRFYPLFDDAMISMRYARNLAEGHGLTWNPGEAPVEGFTNPLWTLWMAALHLAGFSEATAGLALALSAALLVIATAFVVRAVAARLYPDDGLAAAVGFWGTLTYYPLVFWSLRGMEVGLVALLLALGVLLCLRLHEGFSANALVALGAVLSLGLLTRMEFALPAVVIAAFAVRGQRERRWAIAATLGVTIVATLAALTAWRLAYYGELLPNTYYLKVAGIPLDVRLARGVPALLFNVFQHLGPLVILPAIYALRQRARLTRGEVLILTLFAAACGYSAWVGGDAWEDYAFANRYVAPVVPLVLLLTVRAIGSLGESRGRALVWAAAGFLMFALLNTMGGEAPRATPLWARTAGSVGMAIVLLFAATHRPGPQLRTWIVLAAALGALNLAPVFGWMERGAPHSDGDAAMSAYGLLLRQTTAADATIAVTWAGAVSYYSRRTSFDELGKTDDVVAHGQNVATSFRPGHSKWDLNYTIGELRPDVITGLFVAGADDLAQIEAWGYVQLTGSCYYLAGSENVDAPALRAGLATLMANPRFSEYLCPPAIAP